MAKKRMEAELVLSAIDKMSAPLGLMEKATGRFGDKVRSKISELQDLRGPLRLIEDFKKQDVAVNASAKALQAAREKVRQLQAAITSTHTPTAQMRREFDQARAAAGRLEEKHERNRKVLGGLRGELRSAGVNTGNLAAEQKRLSNSVDVATTAFGRFSKEMERVDKLQTRIAKGRERMDRSLATAANLSLAGHASMQTGREILRGGFAPVQGAIEFESAMAGVKKVVDFDSPEAFEKMSADILDLSTRIPIAAEGLAQIVAAGGQIGLKDSELLTFTEMAAKIGVAFDISAEQAGDAMANIRSALGLSLGETGELLDSINHLSNKTASKAPELLDFTNSIAADGKVKGFSAVETTAFGSAMIAAGTSADVAATSFRNMGKALVSGESATGTQSAAFERLGLSAEQVAKDMQVNAVQTTMDVLRRIKELPKHVQSAITSDLFGDEARGLMPIIGELGLLTQALGLVADKKSYAGSSDAEYAAQAETTANQITLTRNQMAALGNTVGALVLPAFNDLLKITQKVINSFTSWAEEHPNLSKAMVIGAISVGALAVAGGALLTTAAGLVGTLAVLRFGLTGISARAAFAAGGLGGLGTAFGGFRSVASKEMGLLSKQVASHSAAISSSLTAIKWKSGIAAFQAYNLVNSAPTDPAELKGFQEGNVKSMDDTFRSIPGLSHLIEGYESIFEMVHGRPAPVEENLVSDKPEVRAAATKVQDVAAGGAPLPTPERLANLKASIPEIQASIAALQGEIDNLGQGPMTAMMAQPLQMEMAARKREMVEVEAEISKTEGAAKDLSAAMQVLSGLKVAPEVSSDSLDVALKRVQQLKREMRGLPSGAVGRPVGAPKVAGARARGGPVRGGLPYLVNENTPRSEIIVPSASGGVLNVGQAQAAVRRNFGLPTERLRSPAFDDLQRGVQGLRAATLAGLSATILAGPSAAALQPQQGAQGAPGAAGGVTIEIHGFVVNVPSGVSDPQAIAEIAADTIARRVGSTFAASFTD